jgi:hypothetical protein
MASSNRTAATDTDESHSVGDDRKLEQRALEYLDTIADRAEGALDELSTGDLDALEDTLWEIRDLAAAWDDGRNGEEEADE